MRAASPLRADRARLDERLALRAMRPRFAWGGIAIGLARCRGSPIGPIVPAEATAARAARSSLRPGAAAPANREAPARSAKRPLLAWSPPKSADRGGAIVVLLAALVASAAGSSTSAGGEPGCAAVLIFGLTPMRGGASERATALTKQAFPPMIAGSPSLRGNRRSLALTLPASTRAGWWERRACCHLATVGRPAGGILLARRAGFPPACAVIAWTLPLSGRSAVPVREFAKQNWPIADWLLPAANDPSRTFVSSDNIPVGDRVDQFSVFLTFCGLTRREIRRFPRSRTRRGAELVAVYLLPSDAGARRRRHQ